MIRLSRALREKRPEYEQRHDKVIILHDNAQPHVAKVKKIFGNAQMGCFTAPASPDIAPSDYWLFRRMQQVTIHFFRRNRKLAPKLDLPKTSHFFDGIRKLLEKWEKVVGNDGQYFN